MDGIQELTHLIDKIPAVGNTTTKTPAPGELSEEEKLKLAEQEIAAKKAAEEAAKKAAGGGGGNPNEQEEEDEPTPEEIQSKLDELAEKEESTLTDEEKEFIQKYTSDDADEITTVKNELESTYGVQLAEKYENGVDGLKALAQDLVPTLAQKLFVNSLASIPHMKEFYEHVTAGYSIDTFLDKNIKPKFETIEVKEVDELADEATKTKATENYKEILRMNLSQKGLSSDDIEAMIDLHLAKGSLYEKAKAAKEELVKNHKASIDAKIKAEEDRIANELKAQEEVFKAAQKIIDSNNFGGLSIPVTDLKSFKEAALVADRDGYTLIDRKREKLTLEQRLLIDYLVYKDFKGIGLTAKPSEKTVFSFKKANKENNSRNGSRLSGVSSQSSKTSPPIDIKNVDFSKLLNRQ